METWWKISGEVLESVWKLAWKRGWISVQSGPEGTKTDQGSRRVSAKRVPTIEFPPGKLSEKVTVSLQYACQA